MERHTEYILESTNTDVYIHPIYEYTIFKGLAKRFKTEEEACKYRDTHAKEFKILPVIVDNF